MEDIKSYQKEMNEQKKGKPKLFALILKYLSDESIEAVKKGTDWDTIKADVDPEGVCWIIEEKHKVY
jgi:hypothetical protein